MLSVIASLITTTQYAVKEGFSSVFFNSEKTLGNVFILFLETLFYGVGMGIFTLHSINHFVDVRKQYPVSLLNAGNIQQSENSENREKIAEVNKKMIFATINILRDGTCAIGAIFAAYSMYFYADQFLLTAAILYGISTAINAPQGINQFRKYIPSRKNSPALFNESAVPVIGNANILEVSAAAAS